LHTYHNQTSTGIGLRRENIDCFTVNANKVIQQIYKIDIAYTSAQDFRPPLSLWYGT